MASPFLCSSLDCLSFFKTMTLKRNRLAKAASFFDANDRRLYERSVVHAPTQLGEQAFETALAEGRAMSSEQAIEYALQPK